MPITFDFQKEEKELRELIERSNFKLLIPELEQCELKFRSLTKALKEAPRKQECEQEVVKFCEKFQSISREMINLFEQHHRKVESFFKSKIYDSNGDGESFPLLEEREGKYIQTSFHHACFVRYSNKFILSQFPSDELDEVEIEILRRKNGHILNVLDSDGFPIRQFSFPSKLLPVAKFLNVSIIYDENEERNSSNDFDNPILQLKDIRIRFERGPVFEFSYKVGDKYFLYYSTESLSPDTLCLDSYRLIASIGCCNLLDLEDKDPSLIKLKQWADKNKY